MQAMILAAGLGTRLKPITDKIPKALVKIKDKTLLELQIKKLKSSGFDQIIINVHHFADQVEEFLKENLYFRCDIIISDEREKLLDTGGALKKASEYFKDEPFVLHNVDVLSNIVINKFYNVHKNNNSIATVAVRERESSRCFLFDNENQLCGWKNKKSGEVKMSREAKDKIIEFAFSGISVIDPKIFKYFPAEKKFSLVDLLLEAAKEEKISAYVHNEDEWVDLGKPENLSQV